MIADLPELAGVTKDWTGKETVRNEVTERSGRRRAVVAAAGVLCAGFVLSASAVDARAAVGVRDLVGSGALATASPHGPVIRQRCSTFFSMRVARAYLSMPS